MDRTAFVMSLGFGILALTAQEAFPDEPIRVEETRLLASPAGAWHLEASPASTAAIRSGPETRDGVSCLIDPGIAPA